MVGSEGALSSGFIAGKSNTSLMSGNIIRKSVTVSKTGRTVRISQEHDQAVNAYSPPTRRGETMLEPVAH
jgi:hypothetical protein